ncbi:MAG: NADH-quinone oxidoreductase subunit B [Opitutales bacterium]
MTSKPSDLSESVDLDDATRSEMEKAGVILSSVDWLYNWARSGSVWPLQFGLACCAIEMISSAGSRFDIARFGSEVFRPSPRQADLLIVSGTVTKKMAPQVVRIFNQMPEPKYVIAMGACAISGGPFKQGYNVLKGIDRYIPVDVYIPGCPPRPEAVLHSLMTLQKSIRGQRSLGKGADNPAYAEGKREYPVPAFAGKDLDPPYNPEVWQPPEKRPNLSEDGCP